MNSKTRNSFYSLWSMAILLCLALSIFVLLFASCSKGGTAETEAEQTAITEETQATAADDTAAEDNTAIVTANDGEAETGTDETGEAETEAETETETEAEAED
ncbi:MAG: hypothetical protein LUG57_07945 [Oscillospiraceae bacterium]|nr:hypothetical protein [Oscillospiraceae bacterium]